MSRIDIQEITQFLHGLKKSNDEAREMIQGIQNQVEEYSSDTTIKGKAVEASQQYYNKTYSVICKTIIEALNESENSLKSYIQDFSVQVDSSFDARIDAELLQEAMTRLTDIRRKQEALMQSLSASTATLNEGKLQTLRTQFTDALEQERILERYINFEQSHENYFDSLSELVYRTRQAVRELADNVSFDEQTSSYHLNSINMSRFQTLHRMLPKKKEYDFDDYEITWQGTMHILWKDGKVDAEATLAYKEASLTGKLMHDKNISEQEAEQLMAVIESLKNKKDPITGADISSVQVLSIISGLTFGYTAGIYKGKKISISNNDLRKIKNKNGTKKIIYNAKGSPYLRALRRTQFDDVLENGLSDGTKLSKHAYNSLFKSGRKDIMLDDIKDALKTKPIPAKPGSVEYINPKTKTSVFVNPETKEIVGIWPESFKR
ncbi:transposase [Listeria welshimeri]|uniref:T7SS effector LXG polymorphic toxin n=1 Tax=Listeria welshimeri TaxID=1643 RepID=UPI00162A5D02|nr:T7SS effector LXG polymorphic toxin [Listeria welshimeri]MBC1412635.1 transposase [Listeria welshimeri]MBC1467986.1 transposase [Listeria welshimeri]MBC1589716.1 transposase [Listeria welshimeri]MBC1623606.1 transposase [Listeria welshimeri]MBC1637866.1 transposase [Listeria welshimeri]